MSLRREAPNKTIAVYPFSREFLPCLTAELFPGAVVQTLVAPEGFALTGKDAGYADNRPAVGLVVQPESVLADMQDDILLVPNGDWADIKRNEIHVPGEEWMTFVHQKCLRFMELAADAGKEIWCAMKLTDDERCSIAARCKLNNAPFNYLYHEPTLVQEYEDIERLYTPEAAVLFVGELMPNTNAFEIALNLHRQFVDNDFCSVLLSAQDTFMLPNATRFPDSLFLEAGDDRRVYDINCRIKEIDENIAPDIIIVCLPDALMKLDSQFTNGFGAIPYLISQAVQADYTVVCVQHDYYNAEFYNTICNDLLIRFGMPVKFYHMSNTKLDMQASHERGNLKFNYLDYTAAQNAITSVVDDLATVTVPACNVLHGNKDRLFHHVLTCLQG